MSNDPATVAELTRLADELFIGTDLKQWPAVEALFDPDPIEVDMTSLIGGAVLNITAGQLVAAFSNNLHPGKASHHMATNYRCTVDRDAAELWAQGYSWNRVATFPAGRDVWETWGTYRLGFGRTAQGWRINAFRYYNRRTAGNDAVRTHSS